MTILSIILKKQAVLLCLSFDDQENALVHFKDDVTDDCQLNVTYVKTNDNWLAESILHNFKKHNQNVFSAACQPLDIGEVDIETYYFIKNNVLYLLQRKDNIIVSSSITYYLQYALNPEEAARISAQHLK